MSFYAKSAPPRPEIAPPGFACVVSGLRYYDAELGRWLSRDLIMEWGFLLTRNIASASLISWNNGFDLSNGAGQDLDEINSGNAFIYSALYADMYIFLENNSIDNIDSLGLAQYRDCNPPQPPKVWREKDIQPPCDVNDCSVPRWVQWLLGWAVLSPGGDWNNPSGNASFLSACQQHDYCYCRCEMTQSDCDDNFHADLRYACANAGLSGDDLMWCYWYADGYANAVRRHGQQHYDRKQNEQCECACPPTW